MELLDDEGAPPPALPLAGLGSLAPSLGDLLGAGDDAAAKVAQALIDGASRYDSAGLRAMLFIGQYNPQLALQLDKFAARRSNLKTLVKALETLTLYKYFQGVSLNLGGK